MKANSHKTRPLVMSSLLVLLAACGGGGGTEGSEGTATIAKAPLSNTGITWGGDATSGNQTDCTSNIVDADDKPVPQDCDHTLATGNDGEFNLVKLDATGTALVDPATVWAEATETAPQAWSCVEDKVTGLIWEVKAGSALHNKAGTYTFGATQDDANNNACFGYDDADEATLCTTQRYVQQVNTAALCGMNDWRVPTVEELATIVDLGKGTGKKATETAYFPNAQSANYWSATANADGSLNAAWSLSFANGAINNNTAQNTFNHIRLVRGGGS